ncbi:NADH-quinone oxidoreductase subunit K [Acuticoccus kalidii]|uniref:NADH-quinone oxidoreductase subunit K n=1 Tax=Acuticoccus kalidii TaxID=2910977 RepID=UPI002107E0B1|nr:NADH-quinone oxidoreductase subunit K [Acuticoccus kalidii]
METILCVVVGLFFAASIYLMLSPHLIRILLGVAIFGNAVNLLIFTSGRLTAAVPPVLSDHGPPTLQTVEGERVIGMTDGGPVAGHGAPVVADGAPGVADSTQAAADAVTPATQVAADAAAHTGAAANAAADAAAHTANAAANASSAALDAALSVTANPLPQALILTAIVISFSIFAFLLVLTFRAYQSLETDNVDDMRLAEPSPTVPPLGY